MNILALLIAAIIVALLLLAAIATVAAVLIFRARGQVGNAARGTPTPLDVLEIRYARGEITREQFLEMRGNLKT